MNADADKRPSEDVLRALYAKRPQVIKPGLERIRAALPAMDPAALATPCVLIAGTNGKGTTTGYLFQMLAAGGVPTGIFTSPHLYEFCERIQVDALPRIDDAALVGELARLRARIPAPVYEAMSFFEVSTLLGLAAFAARGTRVNLLEVGLGGRFDSTNAVEPVLSIIASIGLDHQQYLGDTIAGIAREKAGIMRPRVPVVLGAPGTLEAEAERALLDEAARLGAPVFRAGVHSRFSADGARLAVTVPGLPPAEAALPPVWRDFPAFLRDNLAKAAIAYWILGHEQRLAPDLARAFDAGRLARTARPPSLRARFERTQARGRELLLDVCHNVQGARAFVEALAPLRAAAGGARLPALVSILADKDFDAVLDVLRTALAPVHLFPLDGERSWSRGLLAARHADLPWFDTLAGAWDAAAAAPTVPLVACGSVHGLGQVLRFLGLDVFGAGS